VLSDLGDDDPAAGTDDVHCAIAYQFIIDPATGATFPRPKDVSACNIAVSPLPPVKTPPPQPTCSSANTLRHRGAFFGSKGELRTLTDDHFGGKDPATGNPYVINQTDPLVSAFEYDGFGNLQIATDPTGYQTVYTYEPVANAHIATIRDSFGYQSSRVYDMRFGSLRDTTDVNGYRQHIDADIFGRTMNVFAPQDSGSVTPNGEGTAGNATVAIDYAIPGANVMFGNPPPVFWARSKNKDTSGSNGTDTTIETVVLVDGLGRVTALHRRPTTQ